MRTFKNCKWPQTFRKEGHSANQNAGFESHDNKQPGVSHFVVQHNADKHPCL